jgi:histidine triad (HIT) family protein
VSDDAGPSGECLFCGIVAGTVPSATVLQDEAVVAFLDIDPGADGHLLVVPRRHSADLFSIPAEDLVATTLAAQRIAGGVRAAFGAEGVNLLNCSGGAAWQTVFHFHLHVIPRYADRSRDRMQLPFEPGRPADPDALARRARVLAAAL